MPRPPCLCTGRSDVRCDDRHCDLAHPTGAPGNPDQCVICWQWFHSRGHNLAWGGDGRVKTNNISTTNNSLERQRLPCIYLGQDTGETLPCSTCPSSVRVKVYSCKLHSRCVLGQTLPSTHGCLHCSDHLAPARIPSIGETRNLLFHLYPLREGSVWRWHVEMLKKAIHLFNGKKILALAFDSLTDNPLSVRNTLSPLFDEVIEFTNDPSLREVATFESLFSKVISTDPNEVTLYAHGKGVGHYAHPWVRRWTELLYELNIDCWSDVQRLLVDYPICGSFKKIGRGWPDNESLADWHYSGSWFWFRNRDLFLQSGWRKIDRFWSGIESYPALHFKLEHASHLFHEDNIPSMNLYDRKTWQTRIEPAYDNFQKQRRGLPILDGLKVELGGGDKPYGNGFIDVDRKSAYGLDLEHDRLPFEDDTVAEVYSAHCLEHIRNLHHILHEIVRICKVGAKVTIVVPHHLSSMALCHDHKQVIPPEQVDHWTKSALSYWWKGCTKRLDHIRTTQIPSNTFNEAKHLFSHLTNEQVMRFIPNAAHEIKYELSVVPYAD